MKKIILFSLAAIALFSVPGYATDTDTDTNYKYSWEELKSRYEAENLRPEAKRLKMNLLNSCFACHIPLKGYREWFQKRFGDFSKSGVLNKYAGTGNINNSKLYTAVASDSMPDKHVGQLEPTQKAELLDSIADWIGKGAPSLEVAILSSPKLSGYALEVIDRDLQSQTSQKDIRYISLVHIYNNPETQKQVHVIRNGITKLLNSLSWNPQIKIPSRVDKDGLILRIRLSDYNWNISMWNQLETKYPYILDYWNLPGKSRNIIIAVSSTINSRLPIVRADWLVARLSAQPLYSLFLNLPKTELELERMLKVNTAKNVAEGLAIRAGFQNSGVALVNRVIERHDINDGLGYYWKSYDFNDEIGRNDIMASPLNFEAVTKEMIFSLPNGMQGYMLTDKRGNRIDNLPHTIASDINQQDRSVALGISCIQCHLKGIQEKPDQVSNDRNLRLLDGKIIDSIKRLYRPAQLGQAYQRDIAKYTIALKSTGVSSEEPVSESAALYLQAVQRSQILSEMDMTETDFQDLVRISKDNKDISSFAQMVEQAGQGGLKRSTLEAQTTPAQMAIITEFLRLKLPEQFQELLFKKNNKPVRLPQELGNRNLVPTTAY